jgi:hypothetical protein
MQPRGGLGKRLDEPPDGLFFPFDLLFDRTELFDARGLRG